MTRRKMTEADWQAIARVMFAIHQRRAAEAASVPAAGSRTARLAEMAVASARARRQAAAEGGDGDD
jgi:hypothetical protein